MQAIPSYLLVDISSRIPPAMYWIGRVQAVDIRLWVDCENAPSIDVDQLIHETFRLVRKGLVIPGNARHLQEQVHVHDTALICNSEINS